MSEIRQDILIHGTHSFAWQDDAYEKLKGRDNVILSSKTGTGKTRVFLRWALGKDIKTVYITAPIKALSNQRYRDLLKSGYCVKIETGDMTSGFSGGSSDKNGVKIVCCTQEIYTNHYTDDNDAVLIMDEFHYIFENSDRSRAYIDALVRSSAKGILLSSATFGNADYVREYVERVSGRSFFVYENTDRVTDAEYVAEEIRPGQIHDALVIAFSGKWCRENAGIIASARGISDKNRIEQMALIAERFGVELPDVMRHGVAVYSGSMLPKEKLFVEKCYEMRLIDVVCGTDALALGVNFPVQMVVFTQLDKYYEGPVSKNMFDQLSGRAGRYGYFEKGYVGFWDSGAESYESELDHNFYKLLHAETERPEIWLKPDYKKLICGDVSAEDEAGYINSNCLIWDFDKNGIYSCDLDMDEGSLTNLYLDEACNSLSHDLGICMVYSDWCDEDTISFDLQGADKNDRVMISIKIKPPADKNTPIGYDNPFDYDIDSVTGYKAPCDKESWSNICKMWHIDELVRSVSSKFVDEWRSGCEYDDKHNTIEPDELSRTVRDILTGHGRFMPPETTFINIVTFYGPELGYGSYYGKDTDIVTAVLTRHVEEFIDARELSCTVQSVSVERDKLFCNITIADTNGNPFILTAYPRNDKDHPIQLMIRYPKKNKKTVRAYWKGKSADGVKPPFAPKIFLKLCKEICSDIIDQVMPVVRKHDEKYEDFRRLVKTVYVNSLEQSENVELAVSVYEYGQSGLDRLFEAAKRKQSFRDMMSIAMWYGNVPDNIKDEYNLVHKNIYRTEVTKIDPTATDAETVVEMMKL